MIKKRSERKMNMLINTKYLSIEDFKLLKETINQNNEKKEILIKNPYIKIEILEKIEKYEICINPEFLEMKFFRKNPQNYNNTLDSIIELEKLKKNKDKYIMAFEKEITELITNPNINKYSKQLILKIKNQLSKENIEKIKKLSSLSAAFLLKNNNETIKKILSQNYSEKQIIEITKLINVINKEYIDEYDLENWGKTIKTIIENESKNNNETEYITDINKTDIKTYVIIKYYAYKEKTSEEITNAVNKFKNAKNKKELLYKAILTSDLDINKYEIENIETEIIPFLADIDNNNAVKLSKLIRKNENTANDKTITDMIILIKNNINISEKHVKENSLTETYKEMKKIYIKEKLKELKIEKNIKDLFEKIN